MKRRLSVTIVALACGLFVGIATAQEPSESSGSEGQSQWKLFRFKGEKVELPYLWGETYDVDYPARGYQGVDDFFSVREANANIKAKQWQFELGMGWGTGPTGSGADDLFGITPALKYAYTDTNWIEIGMESLNLGDGTGFGFDDEDGFFGSGSGSGFGLGGLGGLFGDNDDQIDNGNGETFLKYFWQMSHEDGYMPASAFWTHVRFPTGDGSEKIDGTFNLNFTKTVYDGIRWHLGGFIRTANGARGDLNDERVGDRRDFQYSAGTSLDFAINEQNLLLVSYHNRSSDYDGNATTHAYELGWVHQLADNQSLMLASTYNDTRGGFEEGPEWNTRVQWSYSW
ncbi:MAG: hypothetical protein HOP29_09275 [Phycisphaerales bacterium]|nr:hypothetical protein [Phycisphaerales bacterium]